MESGPMFQVMAGRNEAPFLLFAGKVEMTVLARHTARFMSAVAVNPKKREVGLIEHPAPEISHPTEVKFQTIEVGICGTDREICRFDHGNPPNGFEHLVLGHEGLGVVEEVGAEVHKIKPGDL